MNREIYHTNIRDRLSLLAYKIELNASISLFNSHVVAEYFYNDLLNLIFDLSLRNINTIKRNMPSIDLVDDDNKIVVQVSATATKNKVQNSLSGVIMKSYKGYKYKFISISKDASNIKGQEYDNPHELLFNSDSDIYDLKALFVLMLTLDADKLKNISSFLDVELSFTATEVVNESNIASMISFLAKEKWSAGDNSINRIPYDIPSKISYNNLNAVVPIINEYKIYYSRLERIYSEFDKNGVNKSLSVLNYFRTVYVECVNMDTSDEIFMAVVGKAKKYIQASGNYDSLADDELQMCVELLTVDAFVRCKIFPSPEVKYVDV